MVIYEKIAILYALFIRKLFNNIFIIGKYSKSNFPFNINAFSLLISQNNTNLYEFLEDCFYFRLASDPPQKQNRINPAEFGAVFFC